MTGRRIFVTGAAGYLGSRLIKSLAARIDRGDADCVVASDLRRVPAGSRHAGIEYVAMDNDVLGREVAVLAEAVKEAGIHEVTFDGAAFSSGVYFYRLTAGEGSRVRRMLLMK